MKSHTKASSVGSNSDRGASRRSFRRPGALAALLVALLASACLLPGSAAAIEFRSLTGTFGPDGTSGTSFEFPTGLAFDQGNKRLYSLDESAGVINGFDVSSPGTHAPLGGSFPLSVNTSFLDDVAVDSSSHHIFYASHGAHSLFGYDESGAAISGFPVTGLDNTTCGVGVDPSGNAWIAQHGGLKEVSPTGVTLTGKATQENEPCHIAFDSNANLYIGSNFGPTKKYTAASSYGNESTIDSEATTAVAVDRSTNEVYVAHPEYVSVYDEAGNLLYEFGASAEFPEFGGIAIDEATEEVFLADYSHGKIRVYGPPVSVPRLVTEGADAVTASAATVHGTINPKGQAVEDCHFEVITAGQFAATKYKGVKPEQKFSCVPAAGSIPIDSSPHAVSAAVTGLEAATVYHYRLVATNAIGEGKGADRQFTTGATAPLITKQSVEAVGTSEATLTAKINPRGSETTYHLEYGTTNAYGQGSAESVPFGFASDNSDHLVSVHIGGLQPGSAYHFRFVATNSIDDTEGADKTFATYPTTTTFAACPNDAFRTGFGARLPDCRAYEQVTPIEKHGANAQGFFGGISASASGDRVTFYANGGLPVTGGLASLVPYVASRGPGGWSTDGLLPPTKPGNATAEIRGVDEDLSTTLVIADAPNGVDRQLLLRDTATATFQPGPIAPSFGNLEVNGLTPNRAHVLITTNVKLLPEAPPGGKEGFNLYELDHGTLSLPERIPAGSATGCDDELGPACIISPRGASRGGVNRISRDGSRIVFTVNPPSFDPPDYYAGRIYLREDGTRTTLVSASQRTTPDPNGERPAKLVGTTPDGSKVFFTSCEKLTDDSTAFSNGENTCSTFGGLANTEPQQGEDLYRYDVESGELTDLTVDSDAGDPRGAVVRQFIGTSEDGSYAYFIAEGVLAPGASNPGASNPVKVCQFAAAPCNVYVYHDGVTKLIARIDWQFQNFKVSAGGNILVFDAKESLTGYENVGPCSGSQFIPCKEFYRYSAPDGTLTCISCSPTLASPTGFPSLGTDAGGSFLVKGVASAGVNSLSPDGNRFFFESPDALVAGDTNGGKGCPESGAVGAPICQDVYEWEAKGTGSCESESQNGGCIYLISSGTDPQASHFLGASKNGDHAFFFTEQQLVPGDQDHLNDVYDAGVGAGLASQHELAPATCTTTACQANPAPPVDQTPASATFSGPGNAHTGSSARKCPQGKRKVRRKGKVSCQKAHKQHKRHNNRGGSK